MQSSHSFSSTTSAKQGIVKNIIELALDHFPPEIDEESTDSSLFESDDVATRYDLIRELKELSLVKKLGEIQNHSICRKLINYFHKKRLNRAFIYDGDKSDVVEVETRYEDSLQEFTEVCEDEERSVVEMKEVQMEKLRNKNLEEDYQQKVSRYEAALVDVGATLISARSGELLSEKFLQNTLARQKKARDVLCEQRFEYILAEKHACDAQEKLKKLDDLGDGLCMADFEQLRTELQYMVDKIEERNKDLNRLRLKCNADTQKLANIREKRSVLLRLIDELTGNNEESSTKQHHTRDDLNNSRVEYGELKKKYDKMIDESGLLNRMPLLRDYDDTLEKIKLCQIQNKTLEAKIKMMQKQI